MSDYFNIIEQHRRILSEIKSRLDIKSFCQIHGKSEKQINRILNGEVKSVDLELLCYLAMNCGIELSLITLDKDYPKPGRKKHSNYKK